MGLDLRRRRAPLQCRRGTRTTGGILPRLLRGGTPLPRAPLLPWLRLHAAARAVLILDARTPPLLLLLLLLRRGRRRTLRRPSARRRERRVHGRNARLGRRGQRRQTNSPGAHAGRRRRTAARPRRPSVAPIRARCILALVLHRESVAHADPGTGARTDAPAVPSWCCGLVEARIVPPRWRRRRDRSIDLAFPLPLPLPFPIPLRRRLHPPVRITPVSHTRTARQRDRRRRPSCIIRLCAHILKVWRLRCGCGLLLGRGLLLRELLVLQDRRAHASVALPGPVAAGRAPAFPGCVGFLTVACVGIVTRGGAARRRGGLEGGTLLVPLVRRKRFPLAFSLSLAFSFSLAATFSLAFSLTVTFAFALPIPLTLPLPPLTGPHRMRRGVCRRVRRRRGHPLALIPRRATLALRLRMVQQQPARPRGQPIPSHNGRRTRANPTEDTRTPQLMRPVDIHRRQRGVLRHAPGACIVQHDRRRWAPSERSGRRDGCTT